MRVKIKNIEGAFRIVAIVSETIETPGLLGNKETIKAVVYVKDDKRLPHKFLMEDVERYED